MGYQHGLAHWKQPWGIEVKDYPVWLYNVTCPENATTLSNCTHNGFASSTWTHTKDVGAVCYNDDTPDGKIHHKVFNVV